MLMITKFTYCIQTWRYVWVKTGAERGNVLQESKTAYLRDILGNQTLTIGLIIKKRLKLGFKSRQNVSLMDRNRKLLSQDRSPLTESFASKLLNAL